jgi:hypothetical protein
MSEAASIVVRVPLAIRRRPGPKTIVTPQGAAVPAPTHTRADPALVKGLARVSAGSTCSMPAATP